MPDAGSSDEYCVGRRRLLAVVFAVLVVGLPATADATPALPEVTVALSSTSVAPGGSLTATATCTVPPPDNFGSLVGFILGTNIAWANWDVNSDSSPTSLSRAHTFTAPTTPGAYTYQASCFALPSNNQVGVTMSFVVTGTPTSSTGATTTTTTGGDSTTTTAAGATTTMAAGATTSTAAGTTTAAAGATTTAARARAATTTTDPGLPVTGLNQGTAIAAAALMLAGVAITFAVRRPRASGD